MAAAVILGILAGLLAVAGRDWRRQRQRELELDERIKARYRHPSRQAR